MTKRALTALVLAAAAAPALAQAASPVDPSKVDAGSYAIEPNHTQVLFSVSHFGTSVFYGMFQKTSGTLTLDPAKPAGDALDVSVAVDSVFTPSEKLTGELKSADWLDAAKFPAMTFKSTKVEKTGAATAKVMGNLTIHGVTKPVTLDAKFYGAGPNPLSKVYTVGFEVTGTIKRSDFGVKTYVPLIGDEVDLKISAPFEKKG